MLRSASREDSIAASGDSWEHFCREEARQAASSFLDRVRRFKRRNAAARDVHDSTFTNEFSAAFLEESSVLMAAASNESTPQRGGCVNNGRAQSGRSFFSRSVSERGRSSTFARNESKTSVRSGASSGSSSGGGTKKSWWSQLFKWPKSRRRNNNNNGGLGASGEYGSRHGSSSGVRRRVVLEGALQLLDLNETVGPLQWTHCKLVLAEAQSNYQVEIFIPPKSAVPKTTLFCFLIEDVRSTTALELPDSTTCFVIKSQNHGEHVFDADTEVKKQQWIQTLLDCKSSIARSASAQTHLATLPRTPQRTPVRLPNGSASHHSNGVVSVEASPSVRRQRYGILSSYAGSESSDQKRSTLNVGAESDDDTMVDVTSLIRRFHHSSPSRRRKVQSMFVDSHLNSVHPTTMAASGAAPSSTAGSCSRYNPPPMFSHSPPDYDHGYLHHQPPSLPARQPFSSLPVECSNPSSSPPPLPKRNPQPKSTCGASLSSGQHFQPRTSASPNHLPPSLSPSHSSNAPHSLPATTNKLTAGGTSASTSDSVSSTTRALISPRRKYSQPCVGGGPTSGMGPSDTTQPGNLEHCSQSSSSSALHPVSLAAMQRSGVANGRRKSSITSSPGDTAQPMSLMNIQQPQPFQSPKERVRKMSAPVLTPPGGGGASLDDPGQKQKMLFNGITEQEDESPSGDGREEEEARTLEVAESSSNGGQRESEEEVREKEEDKKREEGEAGASGAVADSAPPVPQRPPYLLDSDDYDETNSRKAMFTFPYTQAAGSSGGRGTPPPRRTSSPLCVHHRAGGSNSPQGTPDLVTSQLSFQRQEDDNSGLMTGTLVGGVMGGVGGGPLSLVDRSAPEVRGQRSHSQASNRTDPSTRTNSSSDEVESTGGGGGRGGSMPAINNPIYVETTEGHVEGDVASGQVGVAGTTQQPYEHWATNEQDVANLRVLSRYPWFHGMVSRANASQLVLADGDSGTGMYLVRQSESREGDFVLTFNYHNRAKHLRMAVDDSGCNIQHLWFDDVPSMLDYFKTNSIPLESFWLNDDVKLTHYIDRQASDSFRTTTVVNVDRLSRVPPRRSRSLHLGMANSVNAAASVSNSSNPGTPVSLDTNGSSPASSSNSQSTNSLPQSARNGTGWRLFRAQRSSSAGNVGRIQRRHSANVGSLLNTGPSSHRSSGRMRRNNNNTNAYVMRNY